MSRCEDFTLELLLNKLYPMSALLGKQMLYANLDFLSKRNIFMKVSFIQNIFCVENVYLIETKHLLLAFRTEGPVVILVHTGLLLSSKGRLSLGMALAGDWEREPGTHSNTRGRQL